MTCTDFYASGEQFELHRCTECGFLFTQGAPKEAFMDKYYETPGYISHSDTRKGAVNTVYHWVRSYMLGRKARLVMRESHSQGGRLLDVGTGTGYFAHAMDLRGWQVEAVEKSASARRFALDRFGLTVHDDSAMDTFETGSFDVITLWHVLEHLEPLDKMWKEFQRLLTDKGTLVVAVPNCASFDAQRYGNHWAAYDVPRHLWHFTPSTLQQMASRQGFVLSSRHPMPFDAFYVSMLSEKYEKHPCAFARGLYAGVRAWFASLGSKDRSSSLIYIFHKRKEYRTHGS